MLKIPQSRSDRDETPQVIAESSSNGRQSRRRAATKALERISEWTNVLHRAPEDVEN